MTWRRLLSLRRPELNLCVDAALAARTGTHTISAHDLGTCVSERSPLQFEMIDKFKKLVHSLVTSEWRAILTAWCQRDRYETSADFDPCAAPVRATELRD